ncbi:MAG: hypothetical protein NW201_02950 [Gemmatimonadales bacterium]|nr:hypothetical protein [Gemmatimonadales bacterium]
MTAPRRPLLAAMATLLAACGDGPAPPVTITVLGAPRDSMAIPLVEVTNAAPLPGGRWAILSGREERALLVAPGAGSAAPLPVAELAHPFRLFASRDTILVADWGRQRVARFTAAGAFAGAIPAPAGARGHLPSAVDGAGALFLEVRRPAGPDGAGNKDSAAVVRYAPGAASGDTVARLSPFDLAEVQGEAGRRLERRVFSGEDRWGVLGDGSLWVARVYQNRVDWRAPDGTWRKGRALPDRVLEVTRFDRELFFRGFPPELRRTAEQLPFAPLKPPFEAAFADAGGNVWLEKPRTAADSVRTYHVVRRDGTQALEVRLREWPGERRRLVAIGDGSLLAVTVTTKGLSLLTYPAPALPPAPSK